MSATHRGATTLCVGRAPPRTRRDTANGFPAGASPAGESCSCRRAKHGLGRATSPAFRLPGVKVERRRDAALRGSAAAGAASSSQSSCRRSRSSPTPPPLDPRPSTRATTLELLAWRGDPTGPRTSSGPGPRSSNAPTSTRRLLRGAGARMSTRSTAPSADPSRRGRPEDCRGGAPLVRVVAAGDGLSIVDLGGNPAGRSASSTPGADTSERYSPPTRSRARGGSSSHRLGPALQPRQPG